MGELNDILHDLESSLGPLGGPPAPLEGGITNRNYRVTLGGEEYVVRRPGKDTDLLGIDRGGERLANATAAGLGIAPAVAASRDDCLVTRFVACTPVTASEISERAGEIASALRAFHGSGVLLPTSFWVSDLLGEYASVVTGLGRSLPRGFSRAVLAAARIETAMPRARACPCHNDLLAGNIINACDDGRIMLVDWEYAGMGDPRFDLGNLAVNNDFDAEAELRLLEAYHGTPPSARAHAELRLMRVLSDAREGAWGVVQGAVSQLDFDFAGYAEEHFARLDAVVANAEFEEWLAAACG